MEPPTRDENDQQGLEDWSIYILGIENPPWFFMHPVVAQSEKAAHDSMYVILTLIDGEFNKLSDN